MNVLVLRFGFEERSKPRSECAQCGKGIGWYDLIPVVSYLVLSGRCRACGSAIHIQYPLVELATGALFVLAYLLFPPAITSFGFGRFFALLLFLATGVGIVAYDIRHTLIPLPFVYALGGSAALYRGLTAFELKDGSVLFDALFGCAVLAGFFALVTLVTRGRGMGIGDAYVAGAIGILLGLVGGVTAIMFGIWSATVVYLLLMLSSRIRLFGSRGRVTMKTELPLAPWLVFGAYLVLFTGVSIFEVTAWISTSTS